MAVRRSRRRRLSYKPEELIERALKFVQDDETDRGEEMDLRLQRYAKFRQWTTDDHGMPWEGASDVKIPDLAAVSLRIQDTLYNAVINNRPAVISKATSKSDEEKQDSTDDLLDYQAFVENEDDWLSELIDQFVNDGHFTAFVPWVKETREVSEVRRAPAIPADMAPGLYFQEVIRATYGDQVEANYRTDSLADAWDWTIQLPDSPLPWDVSFYTDKRGVEMVVTKRVVRFDGPKIIPVDREDVLHPVEAGNLQIPGPSNPKGSSHVVLRQRPLVDEIIRLRESGFYDRMSVEQADDLKRIRRDAEASAEQEQRDTMEGSTAVPSSKGVEEHGTVTRYVVFDTLGGEDVVYWVLKDPKMLLRVRRLSEVYPGPIPYRPFGEHSFIPVRGKRTGIGVLELAEGVFDVTKQLVDQALDHGSLLLSPWFFYRPNSTMKPEVIRLWPGEGYPLSDPKNDVHFPTIPSNGQVAALNMMAALEHKSEQVSMTGQFQFGQVPHGKASALRTTGNMAMVAGQGEERPARILRRFFRGLAQVWRVMHYQNRVLLPDRKKVRIYGPDPAKDPYREVKRDEIDTAFDFEFTANVFNTSKMALQQSLLQLAQLYVSPVAIQAGVSNPATIYRLFHDIGKSFGQEGGRYLQNPVGMDFISAEEAIADVMDDRAPHGAPLEGPVVHLQKLQAYSQSPELGFLSVNQVDLLQQWMQVVMGMLQQMQETQALADASGQSRMGQGGTPGPEPTAAPDMSQTQLGPNELLNESLPGAGGGANG